MLVHYKDQLRSCYFEYKQWNPKTGFNLQKERLRKAQHRGKRLSYLLFMRVLPDLTERL